MVYSHCESPTAAAYVFPYPTDAAHQAAYDTGLADPSNALDCYELHHHCPLCAAAGDAVVDPLTGATGSWGSQVIAERFRTKLCAKWFSNGGVCPYENRCMFAHGDHELRTVEMNLRDGLTTDEAIRAFKAAIRQKARRRAAKRQRHRRNRARAAAEASGVPCSEAEMYAAFNEQMDDLDFEDTLTDDSDRTPTSPQPQQASQTSWYTHNPYAPVMYEARHLPPAFTMAKACRVR